MCRAVITGECRLGEVPATAEGVLVRHLVSVREHNRQVTAPNRPRWTVLTAVALVALNLRTALASVPTVESDIQAATGWSETVIGALTMLPVLCMGAFALIVPRLARRIGRRSAVPMMQE